MAQPVQKEKLLKDSSELAQEQNAGAAVLPIPQTSEVKTANFRKPGV
jgi:hypothetical protein